MILLSANSSTTREITVKQFTIWDMNLAICRYENLIQVRCLLEGVSTDDILNDWHTLLPEYMDKWKQSRKEVTS